MKSSWLLLASFVIFTAAEFFQQVEAGPYMDEDDDLPLDDDYSENALEHILQSAQKRACIRRGGNCDHRPNDCCYNSSCRCNLWGANCRCQRMGLFQKWG